jgi:hypothetical protein
METKIHFKDMKIADSLFNQIMKDPSLDVPRGQSHHIMVVGEGQRRSGEKPVLESDERAEKLAEAWFDVLKDIAVKCRDDQEMLFIRDITDATWPSLVAAKKNGLPIEAAQLTGMQMPYETRKKAKK